VSPSTWLLFVLTAVGMSLTPGPNGLLALTHGALYGRARTVYTIVGGVLGFVAVIALCLFGIGALVRASPSWFTALKWAGGAYLVWLGVKLWRAAPIPVDIAAAGGWIASQPPDGALFRQGLFAALTNPKALLFFSAFLPQFIDPARNLYVQFVVLAATYAVTEFGIEYLFASAAQRIRPWLARAGRRFNRVCGGVFVAVGALLPLRA